VKNRKGFTIIEVVVAVLVLTVGVLGLSATAALVTRMIGQGQRLSEATALAQRRFEILRSQSCSAITSGTETVGRYTLTWRTTDVSGRAVTVNLAVTSPTADATRTDTFQTTIPC